MRKSAAPARSPLWGPAGWVMIYGQVNPLQLKSLVGGLTSTSLPISWFSKGHFYEKRKNIGTFLVTFTTGKINQYWHNLKLNSPFLFYLGCQLFSNFPLKHSIIEDWECAWGKQLNSDTRECICHSRSHCVQACHTLTRPRWGGS